VPVSELGDPGHRLGSGSDALCVNLRDEPIEREKYLLSCGRQLYLLSADCERLLIECRRHLGVITRQSRDLFLERGIPELSVGDPSPDPPDFTLMRRLASSPMRKIKPHLTFPNETLDLSE
jgi:hypothetical protein